MRTVPSEKSWNLFTTAAMMSVPPVEPLCRNTTASDVPVIIHPMMSDMNS